METRVYTALNGRNEEVEVRAIDELMEMIATEWKRCRKARADLAEAEFYVKAHKAEVARSEHRLEVLEDPDRIRTGRSPDGNGCGISRKQEIGRAHV